MIAGTAQMTSMYLQTCPVFAIVTPRIALKTYAKNCPPTIISSFWVTIRPLFSCGAISAKKAGTIAEAPPTASPSKKRKAAMMKTLGANAVPSDARKNKKERLRIILRRPYRSANLPHNNAPNAAPNKRILVTSPSVTGVKSS